MTVCIGIAEQGQVRMGADSVVAGGYVTFRRKMPKIFQNGAFLIGVAGTARVAELMRYADLPIPTGDIDRFMGTVFAEYIRELMRVSGRLIKENEVESVDSRMIIGVHGTLWVTDGFFSLSRPDPAEYAIGAGDEIAMGALYATRGQSPTKRISIALRAAGEYGTGIGPPYV